MPYLSDRVGLSRRSCCGRTLWPLDHWAWDSLSRKVFLERPWTLDRNDCCISAVRNSFQNRSSEYRRAHQTVVTYAVSPRSCPVRRSSGHLTGMRLWSDAGAGCGSFYLLLPLPCAVGCHLGFSIVAAMRLFCQRHLRYHVEQPSLVRMPAAHVWVLSLVLASHIIFLFSYVNLIKSD